MWTRKELKDRCKVVMKRNYWYMFLVSAILAIVVGVPTVTMNYASYSDILIQKINGLSMLFALWLWKLPFLALAFECFIVSPIRYGVVRYYLLNTKKNPDLKELLFFFNHNYLNTVKIAFYVDVQILLWSFLFIIPGIMKYYEYSMIPYLLAENPNLNSQQVFALSKKMMYGEKMNKFVLDLSFIGWELLGGLLVIGTFFVDPYVKGTEAEFYLKMKNLHL